MKYDKTFDSLSHGTHFQTADDGPFIKVKNITEWYGWSVWYQDDWGNKNKFNAISYNGTPTNIKWDEKVAIIDPSWNALLEELKFFGESFSKNPLDNSTSCDKVEESKATTDVVAAELLKNKHIETTKQMNTYNNLTEAVIAAINELKAADTLSAHQITQLIRQKTNQDEWVVVGSEARPNQQNIKYWINHDDVRRILNELYANNELDALGFTGRQFNGTYMEYTFGSTPLDASGDVAGTAGCSTGQVNPVQSTPVPATVSTTSQRLDECIESLKLIGGDVTLKRVQSALKTKGLTCDSLYKILTITGYTVNPGPSADDYYSQYVVE
jgi:hypothetical protein